MTGSAEPPAPRATAETDLLRLDYQQTIGLLAGIGDVRFKLLALVPTLSGAAVAVLGRPSSSAELLAVGAIGLIATLGVLLYELRNTQLYDYGLNRAQMLEESSGLRGAGRRRRARAACSPTARTGLCGCSEPCRSTAMRASAWSTAQRSQAGPTSLPGELYTRSGSVTRARSEA